MEQPSRAPKVIQQNEGQNPRLSSASLSHPEVGLLLIPEVIGSPLLGDCPASLTPWKKPRDAPITPKACRSQQAQWAPQDPSRSSWPQVGRKTHARLPKRCFLSSPQFAAFKVRLGWVGPPVPATTSGTLVQVLLGTQGPEGKAGAVREQEGEAQGRRADGMGVREEPSQLLPKPKLLPHRRMSQDWNACPPTLPGRLWDPQSG